ncbi:MFS transporter [Caldivirga maquilingensis]|uniref:Major facilitator superfamily MFS_1 n=1 Tax=Caldivirga maquilingensis (strain ATCC 700844 / DSM 13496 / JCM 10307 / IC-167) TaxID=397948 RepID=A8MDY3_CALMQ|nr:MFS transporter [Caldivirga maquilingensis]ABW01989.1 major facilitator superfamily MFS_1 [Caldivirga maquilingensis IC-167]
MAMGTKWNEVWKISFSAFFADLGYQVAVVVFPLIFVLYLGAPIWLYGVAEAINYGLGAFLGFLGGLVSDVVGRKRVALVGNAVILVLTLLGFSRYWWQALVIFMIGWWARNFRTPPRRAMLTEVTQPSDRSHAFGILHALDITGAVLAITYTAVLLFIKFPIEYLLAITAIPLTASTLLLSLVNVSGARVNGVRGTFTSFRTRSSTNLWFIVVSTFLFGFSQYSFGFPIITTMQFTHEDYLAVVTYGVFLTASAIFGYLFGKLRLSEYRGLAFLGYLMGSVASLGFALLAPLGILGTYPMAFLLGIAVAGTEVFEPTIVSRLVPEESLGSGMGMLTLGRSIGLLLGNSVMGLLYQIHYTYSYYFASATSFAAFIIIMLIQRTMKLGLIKGLNHNH